VAVHEPFIYLKKSKNNQVQNKFREMNGWGGTEGKSHCSIMKLNSLSFKRKFK